MIVSRRWNRSRQWLRELQWYQILPSSACGVIVGRFGGGVAAQDGEVRTSEIGGCWRRGSLNFVVWRQW
jgi:hypothetical protein